MKIDSRTLALQKAICELENQYPTDNLITCYKDFLKVRDYLPYYQFNSAVFRSLIELTINLWETPKQINRLSLLTAIYKYRRGKKETLDAQTQRLLFMLFRNPFEKANFLTEKQIDKARMICNSLLINKSSDEDSEIWLCENENLSSVILNRILRYPIRSKIISQWIDKHFDTNKFAIRRAEAIGWLLDENPDFVINKQILLTDFEYINEIDTKIIMSGRGSEDERGNYLSWYSSGKTYNFNRLTYRPYVSVQYEDTPDSRPDFSNLRQYFNDNIDIIAQQTMLWAVAYSRLDTQHKTELLKKYYSSKLYYSLLNIGKKQKLLEVLKWLQHQPYEISRKDRHEIHLGNIPVEIKQKENISAVPNDCPF